MTIGVEWRLTIFITTPVVNKIFKSLTPINIQLVPNHVWCTVHDWQLRITSPELSYHPNPQTSSPSNPKLTAKTNQNQFNLTYLIPIPYLAFHLETLLMMDSFRSRDQKSVLMKFLLVSVLTLGSLTTELTAKGNKTSSHNSTTTPSTGYKTVACKKAWSYVVDANGNFDNSYPEWSKSSVRVISTEIQSRVQVSNESENVILRTWKFATALCVWKVHAQVTHQSHYFSPISNT